MRPPGGPVSILCQLPPHRSAAQFPLEDTSLEHSPSASPHVVASFGYGARLSGAAQCVEVVNRGATCGPHGGRRRPRRSVTPFPMDVTSLRCGTGLSSQPTSYHFVAWFRRGAGPSGATTCEAVRRHSREVGLDPMAGIPRRLATKSRPLNDNSHGRGTGSHGPSTSYHFVACSHHGARLSDFTQYIEVVNRGATCGPQDSFANDVPAARRRRPHLMTLRFYAGLVRAAPPKVTTLSPGSVTA